MSDRATRPRGGASTLALLAIPPLAASAVVLAIAGVDSRVWVIHLSAIALAGLIAASGHRVLRRASAAPAILLLTLAGIASTLLHGGAGPHRWVALGPLNLYLAPVLLPSFIAACAAPVGRPWSAIAPVGVALLLAIQPDASQVLALLAAMAILCERYRRGLLESGAMLAALGLIAAWAFSRPDPLEPVPHVEGVFALAIAHSVLAGACVIAAAVGLMVGLAMSSRRGPAWLAAVAAYYAVLFGCSVFGLTPAPLIGYGAGPVLGYGLLIASRRSTMSSEGSHP